MKKLFTLIVLLSPFIKGNAQELYVFSEPASNMPAHSISVKLTDHFVTNDKIYGRLSQRFMPQVMFGFSKKFMVHAGATISNMHTSVFRYESFNLYAKYRFLSNDDIHKHFSRFFDVIAGCSWDRRDNSPLAAQYRVQK